MKSKNIPKIIWISAIFLSLIIILICVMDYKINFEYKIKNKLYFYDCNGILCVTEVEDDDHLLYSNYECGYNDCPVFKAELEDSYAIIENSDASILYNYRNGRIISDDYDDYNLLNNGFLIVTKNHKQGIINTNNELKVSVIYDSLGYFKDDHLLGYNLNYIIAKKNDKYGIVSIETNEIVEDFNYSENEIDSLFTVLSQKENSIE